MKFGFLVAVLALVILYAWVTLYRENQLHGDLFFFWMYIPIENGTTPTAWIWWGPNMTLYGYSVIVIVLWPTRFIYFFFLNLRLEFEFLKNEIKDENY